MRSRTTLELTFPKVCVIYRAAMENSEMRARRAGHGGRSESPNCRLQNAREDQRAKLVRNERQPSQSGRIRVDQEATEANRVESRPFKLFNPNGT